MGHVISASDNLPSIRADAVVSIAIAARDRPRLLREAIESVRRQAYPHWELVVVIEVQY